MDNDNVSLCLSNESEDNPNVDHAQVVLLKMEEANRQIETDAKSVSSILQSSSPERQPSLNESAAEVAYWTSWASLIRDWDTTKKNKETLRDMTKKGIPQPLRAIAWQLLTNAQDSPLKNDYASLIGKSGPFDKVIQRDLARTFPDHEFFRSKPKRNVDNDQQQTGEGGAANPNDSQTSTASMCEGQESLFNVLKAYSLVDREVGYCQGSAFIAGLLLLQLPEEEAFCVFAKLMQDYRLRELYKPAMTELGLCIFQLENLIQEHVPKLYIHFTSIGFHTTIFATSWFLTLFNTTFPLDICFRLMDLFVLDGMEVIFRLALGLLLLSEHDLLQLDMEACNSYMQSLASTYQNMADILIQVAYDTQKVRINSRSMKKWEKEFINIQNRQEEEQIEMRRLRTETKLLRQRLEYLERENEHIADALVQYQLSTAEATDEINRLRAHIRSLKAQKVSLSPGNSSGNGKTSNNNSTVSMNTTFGFGFGVGNEHDRPTSPASREDSTPKRTAESSPNRVGSIPNEYSNSNSQVQVQSSHDCPRNCAECQKKRSAYAKESRLLIEELQSELVTSRLKEAELSVAVRELKERIAELEEENNVLLRKPKAEVLALQNELISVKLREAETNLNLKDLELKLNSVQKLWKARDQLSAKIVPDASSSTTGDASNNNTAASAGQQVRSKISSSASFSFGFLSSLPGIGQSGGSDNASMRNVLELQDELISTRLKEAESAAELRSLQKRVMELESQTQLVQRQLSRVEDENAALRERAAEHELMRKRVANDCRTLEMRLAEAETREKQKDVQFRILECELRSQISELEERLASAEIRALEKTVTDNCARADGQSQMCMSTMSTSVFDPESYRLQLTQSIIGDLGGDLTTAAAFGPASDQSTPTHNCSNTNENANANVSADATKTTIAVSIPTLERVQQIMERVSPYEKYGRLTNTAIDNDAE